MGWLGLDDTDTVKEGCTTFSLHLFLNHLPPHIEVGELRLVRLWPFAHNRTRGNAAVAVELKTNDEKELLNLLNLYWEQTLQPLVGKIDQTTDHQRQQTPTDPGMVWYSSIPDRSNFYLDAVRREVRFDEAPTPTHSWGGGGRIGAAAAVVWPKRNLTWEAIAWRFESRWNTTKRMVCEQAITTVTGMKGMFLTRNPRSQHSLISPRGTCPVLFGVRGRTPEITTAAAKVLVEGPGTEDVLGWRVFATNQASDDHLERSIIGTVESVEVLARGTTVITTEHGQWIAFAESGDVKLMAQGLVNGDQIEAFGLFAEANVLHIEKLRTVQKAPTRWRPKCSVCQRTMKSMGQDQGVRCPVCKQRQTQAWIVSQPENHDGAWVQPPPDARRHLARPIEWLDEPMDAA
ncbi:MAG: DUF1743 domain-containing protein [Candidatus Poseidoniaceae archaeon]|jgi:tRNA(Ile2)-agmatinylcytidine synthase|tara:strand:- start:5544 stop:6752 length:1209 start_codon:yes stop_codon:yes gene_type:complete